MRIDRMTQGICPRCGQFRGSLWTDRDTGAMLEPCVKCRREGHGASPLTPGIAVAEVTRTDHDENLAPDPRQPAGAVCEIDLTRAPFLASAFLTGTR